MNWASYFGLCIAIIIMLISDISANGSGQAGHNSRARRSPGLSPTTFAEKTMQKRAIRAQNKIKAQHGAVQVTPTEIKISAPFCVEEGVILIQGENNYFMKCKVNPVTGGFFQIIYICPSDLRSVDDTTKCIPPPDCKDCADANNAGTGGGDDIYGFNAVTK